jgi:16S rRNA (guanine966-N2)-methyltransferase
MVDDSPQALAALEAMPRLLGAGERLEIVRSDAVRFASPPGSRFDVLFLDPPFHQGWIDRLAPMLPALWLRTA